MKVVQSRSFAKRAKRFQKQEKQVLDKQVRAILNNPKIGQEKRGELRGVFVHKFKIHTTQYLLAYRIKEKEILELIMIGPHENYYRDLEKYAKDSK
ncbi:type II toxin-antitoxin system RelE/ParE family toxin [Candidatus Fermentibacteria bacterium]|nr:MAG: type II toxin-antitoxin system RelE/ParE family toxin [Candidatus Fermentibacteria bacterium]